MPRTMERERVLRTVARLVVLLAAFISPSSEGQEKPGAQAGIQYYQAACHAGAAGNGLACYRLAELYWEGGQGVAQDRARAGMLYRKACDAGEQKACVRLAQGQASAGGQPPRSLPAEPTTQPSTAALPAAPARPTPTQGASVPPPSAASQAPVPAQQAELTPEQKEFMRQLDAQFRDAFEATKRLKELEQKLIEDDRRLEQLAQDARANTAAMKKQKEEVEAEIKRKKAELESLRRAQGTR